MSDETDGAASGTDDAEAPPDGGAPTAEHIDTADEPVSTPTAVVSASPGLLAAAGMASLGSGAIHAAAIGVHAEHRQAAIAFTVLALLQIGWGALALVRSGKLVALAGIAIGATSVGGWAIAKSVGIGFVDGLEVPEPAQLADGVCAALAFTGVLLALVSLLPIRIEAKPGALRLPAALTTLAVIMFTFAGMVAASNHTHEHTVDGHTHGTDEAASGHTHQHAQAAVAPVPYDPERTIDLGGVPGVTPEQQAAAEAIVRDTVAELPQWADYRTAEAAGFHSIGDSATGVEHFINEDFMGDDVVLDPNKPESLVYDTTDGGRRLVAAMFMQPRGLPLEDVPDYGGALMQWHVHDNLCYTDDGHVAGVTAGADGACPEGLHKPEPTPMIHVWIEPHPCGPFAALEGIGGGTIPEGESRLCDTAHGSGDATSAKSG